MGIRVTSMESMRTPEKCPHDLYSIYEYLIGRVVNDKIIIICVEV